MAERDTALPMMHEGMHEDATGAILFDVAASSQVDHDWFEPEHWRQRDALRMQVGGRGGVAMIATPAGDAVLRHYRRGGAVAKLMGDRYLWTGVARTRPFREFRLLREIARLDLPGPTAIAARYCRHGRFYTADLITRRIADARTLAECFAAGELNSELAGKTGDMLARFHRAGVWHADLNAHNVMVNADGLHLIDFDRGRMRPPQSGWQQGNLQRLRRSLVKLGAAATGDAAFETAIWQPLLQHYRDILHA